MDIFEITNYQTGYIDSSVNYLLPSDSFQNLKDGLIYRQVLKSRRGIELFCSRLDGDDGFRRVIGIFEHDLPDGTKDLLAFDQNYCYKYNTGTGEFDKISFGGSLAAQGVPYTDMGISGNEFYISGTSYLTKDNLARFVFCCPGITAADTGSKIFYYDNASNTILDFTNVADNADYAHPAMGSLTSATHVIQFGERLNFFLPVISAVNYPQGILYSGIRDSSGNGDKFNAVGSGLLQADTAEFIQGVKQLGNNLVVNFDRSNWYIEKTTDAFNPYLFRKIPGVIGSSSPFSSVTWADTNKCVGQTGIVGTDIRTSLRVDNKIPNFTSDIMNPKNFDEVYGGFDRVNNIFMWTYIDTETDDDTANRLLINNYEFDTWAVYGIRLTVFGETDLGIDLTWDEIFEDNNPSWIRWDTTEEIWNKIGIGESVQKTLAGDDEGFIYSLNQQYDDYSSSISAITNANPAVLTIDASAYKVGDKVVIENVEGMVEINNYDSATNPTAFNLYTVTAASDTSITLNIDSSQFGTYTTGGTVSKVIEFEAETIPFNPYRANGYRVYISHVDFLLSTDGGFLYVDVYADNETTPFKKDVLIQPTSTRKNDEWVTMSVNNEAEFMTFVLKQTNPSAQVKVTSMRLYTTPAGLTYG